MADKYDSLTPAEWILMKAVWERGTATVREIHEAVCQRTGWAYSTVKTMLERMEKKGLLRVQRVGPVKRFSARRRRRDLLQKAVERFLDNVLDGSLAPLIPYIAKARGLSAREIQELKRILEED